ncbi:hypothetical protein NMG29_40030 [Streptomyces cocklensis]|nr:hypothetical protein [Actinacidiphila cocklensis]
MSMITYAWNQMRLAGPGSRVMSQMNTCEGPVATSSGIVLGGWVAWRRRSPFCPAADRIRYIVRCEHQ